ncbi:MAG: CdaR family protein [Desulfobacca sp.]|uniref:CdaR family protein n=1 Tax=Desulfobacca sp. TaxID=2067990 RepID=UPI004049BB9D
MIKYIASLKRNKGLKLLAFILALAAWFAVGSEERTETTLQLALELTNIPKQLMVTNEIPSQIEVRVQGPRSVIRELADEKLRLRLDLSNSKPGTRNELITTSALNLPRGVIVSRIRPNALAIDLDQAVSRRLEVRPVIKGSPAPGFEVGEITVTPKETLVRGPQNAMQQLKQINTIPIDITKLSSSVTREVELDFQNLPLTALDNQPFVAKITIRPKLQTKVFQNIVVVPYGASNPLRLRPTKVSVTVRGPATNLEVLRPEDITPRINLKNLKPGSYEAKIAVEVPTGLEVVAVAPEKIKVTILR